MAETKTFVFVHRAEGFVPAGLLVMTQDGRRFATFSYGNRSGVTSISSSASTADASANASRAYPSLRD